MKSCVLFSKSRRTGFAAVRRLFYACVLFVYLFSITAFGLQIPNTVTSIEEGAFIGNTAITTIVIPENVTFIGKEAFADCTNLKTITIYAEKITLEDNALGRLGETRTIIGHDGTEVETYANLYGFAFEPIYTKADKLLAYADTLLGRSYGEMDCVGFVNRCYKYGISMSTGASTTNDQAPGRVHGTPNYTEFEKYNQKALKITKITDLKPGDIICWKNDEVDYCTHVGLYVGPGTLNGKDYTSGIFIESSQGAYKVRYNYIPVSGGSYYTRNFMYAWRIIDQ